MLYGRSDIAELTVPATGHRHTRKKGYAGPFTLDCADCEPVLQLQEGPFWSTSLEDAPLTETEVKQREAAKEQVLLGQVSEFEEFRRWQAARRAGTTTA
jgi:hypothetical protein